MTENQPFVSIIIPCLNEENYIGMCLDSIIAQDREQKLKLLLENWRKFTESIEDPELWGNCGMVAVAIAEEAQNRGLEPMLVLVHDADDDNTILYGE